jgi:hypothetical protein
MRRTLLRLWVPALLLTIWLAAAGAIAATIGFDGTMGGASVVITNTSTSALITHITLTIGDTAFSFDTVNIADGGANGVTLNSPDRVQGGVTTKLFDISFSSFDPNAAASFPFDIDDDANSGLACCGVSGVLINNGAAPNAVLTVDFSSGQQVVFSLPDTQAAFDDPFVNPSACPSSPDCPFSFSQTVPEPGIAALGAGSFLALVASRRRLWLV